MNSLINRIGARGRTQRVCEAVVVLATILATVGVRMVAQPQAASPNARRPIDFGRDIAPIFQKNCLPCHSGEKPQGGLRLDTEAHVLKGGESGKAIVPGDSEKSALVRRLMGVGEEARMPMGADPLPAPQIKLIRAWIDQNSFAVAEEPAAAPLTPVAAHTSENSEGVFASQIRPILAARCYSCHGANLQQNGLRLDSLAALLKGSANGPVVVPGDSEKSPLGAPHPGIGPPSDALWRSASQLADDVELIRKWIDQGASGPDSSAPIASPTPA